MGISVCSCVPAFAAVVLFGTAAVAQDDTSGSGFFVNEQGWLMTNRHVVEDCADLSVDGAPVIAMYLDEDADLALLHAPHPEGNIRLTLRRNTATLAEPLALVGYPLPALLSEGVKITLGEVNALQGAQNDLRYFQMSAPAQPGNSGGPVLDENGLVIGVFAATLSDAAFDGAQNVNFALSTEEVFRFLDAVDVGYRDMTWPRGAIVQLGGPTIADRAVDASEAVAMVRCMP